MKDKIILIYRCLILLFACMLLFMACTPAYVDQEKPQSTEEATETEETKPGSTAPPSQEDYFTDEPTEDPAKEDNMTGEGKTSEEGHMGEEDHNIQIDVEQTPVMTIEEYITYFEEKYTGLIPNSWGERVKGVITEIYTEDKVDIMVIIQIRVEDKGKKLRQMIKYLQL